MGKRKKIAAFVNDWSDSYAMTVTEGIRKCAKEKNADVFIFVDFSCGLDENDIRGELNIQLLPNLREFDGVIMMSNTFNFQYAIMELKERIEEAGIPSVTLEYEVDGMDFYGTENTIGIRDLTDHLIEKHEVKDIVFICGHKDNKESQERLAAVKESVLRHGLVLPEENILIGSFSDKLSYSEFEQWHEKNKHLPDAVICANDIMAMGVLNYLDSKGICVPEDVIVTGYDHIEQGMTSSPALTTVGRDWSSLGYYALIHVLDRIEGKPVKMINRMKSFFVPSESCGCPKEENALLENFHSTPYGKKKSSMDFDSHNRAMYKFLREANDKEKVSRALSSFFTKNNEYEGENCCVCLIDAFFSGLNRGDLPEHGYGERVHVVANIKHGQALPTMVMSPRQIIPWDNSRETSGHIYVVVPMHSEQYAMGYSVFEDNVPVLDSYILYTWTRHFNQYLEQVRSNMRIEQLNVKLRELSVTDALTGIYNRMGYKEFAIPYLEENRSNGKNTVLMIADINRMKVINDQFGHTSGDLAIMLVAKALKKALPGWVLVRYGGDEFLMVGDCDTKEQQKRIKQKINRVLKEVSEEAKIAFPLSISVGAVIIEKSSTLSVEDCFKKADRSMYIIKNRHHKRDLMKEQQS